MRVLNMATASALKSSDDDAEAVLRTVGGGGVDGGVAARPSIFASCCVSGCVGRISSAVRSSINASSLSPCWWHHLARRKRSSASPRLAWLRKYARASLQSAQSRLARSAAISISPAPRRTRNWLPTRSISPSRTRSLVRMRILPEAGAASCAAMRGASPIANTGVSEAMQMMAFMAGEDDIPDAFGRQEEMPATLLHSESSFAVSLLQNGRLTLFPAQLS